jgi:hypothetical protein
MRPNILIAQCWSAHVTHVAIGSDGNRLQFNFLFVLKHLRFF